MRVQVFRLRLDKQQPGDDLALGRVLLQEAERRGAVLHVVIGRELAQRDLGAVMLLDDLDGARFILDLDRHPRRDHVEPVHRLVVLAHEVEALGRAGMVVERHAGRDDVDEGRARDARSPP